MESKTFLLTLDRELAAHAEGQAARLGYFDTEDYLHGVLHAALLADMEDLEAYLMSGAARPWDDDDLPF